MILVLQALRDMGGINRRRQVIDFISKKRWYQIIGDDLAPTTTSIEPRYRIGLAWARKDCVLKNYIENFERDSWELNRDGRFALDELMLKFQSNVWNIRQCEYLTTKFKSILVPGFEPSDKDRKRLSEEQKLKALMDEYA